MQRPKNQSASLEFAPVDYQQAAVSAIPEGKYEVVIKTVDFENTKNGTDYIGVVMVVRNDIEQKYKNRKIFYQLWKRKEPSEADKVFGGYGCAEIQALSKAAGLENGKNYDSFDDWFISLEGKSLKVNIRHEEYNGNTNARVRGVEVSGFPYCNHIWPDGVANPDIGFEEVSTEDPLPF